MAAIRTGIATRAIHQEPADTGRRGRLHLDPRPTADVRRAPGCRRRGSPRRRPRRCWSAGRTGPTPGPGAAPPAPVPAPAPRRPAPRCRPGRRAAGRRASRRARSAGRPSRSSWSSPLVEAVPGADPHGRQAEQPLDRLGGHLHRPDPFQPGREQVLVDQSAAQLDPALGDPEAGGEVAQDPERDRDRDAQQLPRDVRCRPTPGRTTNRPTSTGRNRSSSRIGWTSSIRRSRRCHWPSSTRPAGGVVMSRRRGRRRPGP